jgi:hypothetical protein
MGHAINFIKNHIMKNITMALLLLLGMNLVSCQELTSEKMTKQFILDLFDDNIPVNSIVETYLQIEPDSKSKLSLSERKNGAMGIIEKTRKGNGVKGSWLIPNIEIKYMKNLKIYPYKKFESLNKFKISGIETLKENIYVLLSSNKEEILQYFLLNKNHNKILSFSLLVKAENQAWFFTY